MDDFSKYETDSQAYDQIALISKMDDLAYGMQRKEISKQLGVNLKTLDNLRKQKQADHLQESSDDIVEITSPWHNPIDAVDIGNELQRLIFRHLALKQEEYATAIVLFSFRPDLPMFGKLCRIYSFAAWQKGMERRRHYK